VNTPINLTPYPGMEENGPSTSFHNGYGMSGNFTLERELARETVLQVGYVMNNAVGLFASEYPNGYAGALPQYAPLSAVSPNLSEVMVTDNHGHSTYNSLQSSLRKTVPSAGMVSNCPIHIRSARQRDQCGERGQPRKFRTISERPNVLPMRKRSGFVRRCTAIRREL